MLTQREIFRRWWPLALSWFFMGLELPAMGAVLARIASPEIHLAALGGVIFPISFLIEAPILMMLSAGTALVTNRAAYARVYRYVIYGGLFLGGVHALVSATPLYHLVVSHLLAPPKEVADAARLGLIAMIVFTPAVGHRRFQQGVLIRAGRSRPIGAGTAIRLACLLGVLVVGADLFPEYGAAVAGCALSIAVIVEGVFIAWVTRNVLREAPLPSCSDEPELSFSAFSRFYAPLALITILFVSLQPMASAAMSRMPDTIHSLAAWPVIGGFLFMVRSLGIAFNEVVISCAKLPGSVEPLWRFGCYVGLFAASLLLFAAVTPLYEVWFVQLSQLPVELRPLVRISLLLALPAPFISAVASFYQGFLLAEKESRIITLSVVAYLITSTLVLVAGVWLQLGAGIYSAVLCLALGASAQLITLRHWWKKRNTVSV